MKNAKSSLRNILSLLFFMLCASIHSSEVQAQVSFTVQAPKTVNAGGQFKVKFVLSNAEGTDFSCPAFSGFEKLAGPSESHFSNFQYINGKTSKTSNLTFTYVLHAQKKGSFSIPAASIKAGGKTLRTKPFTITVIEGHNNASGRGGVQEDDEDFYVKPQNAGSAITLRDLYFTADATKHRVYEQEPIVITYKVHAKLGVALTNVMLKQKPDLKGFWTQEIELPRNLSPDTERQGNSLYRVATNLKYMVFPQQTGKITIPGISFECDVLQRDVKMDAIDAFFNGGGNINVKVMRKSPDINIEVLPLPSPRPVNFSGGVGNFNIRAKLITPTPRTNDVATLRITISGKGNMKLIKAPGIEFPKDFEHFEPKTTDNTKVSAEGITGEMYFDYTFVPRNVGKYTLQPQDFVCFNPESRRYVTLSVPAISIDVKKGTRSSHDGTYNAEARDFDIAPYHHIISETHPDGVWGGGLWVGSLLNVLLYLLLLAVGICTLLAVNKRISLRADTIGWRNSQARKAATRTLGNLEREIAGGKETPDFYTQLYAVLRKYFIDKLNLNAATLTNQSLLETLKRKAVDEQTLKQLHELLETCDYARFAPDADSSRKQFCLHLAIEIIARIDPTL